MNVILPPSTPQVLTEQIFINHGMFLGNATTFMIQAAFSIAENMVARDIGTFLQPTTVTGSIPFLGFDTVYQAPVGKLISVSSVTFREQWPNDVERLISGTAVVVNHDDGLFTIKESSSDISTCNGCGGSSAGISSVDIVFTAGYPAGTIANGSVPLLALCMAADIVLKMMYDEGIGVIYENLVKTQQVGRVIQTFEMKGFLGNTVYGPSSRGHWISNMLMPYKIRPSGAGKLGK